MKDVVVVFSPEGKLQRIKDFWQGSGYELLQGPVEGKIAAARFFNGKVNGDDPDAEVYGQHLLVFAPKKADAETDGAEGGGD